MNDPDHAFALLEKLGATPWLIRHHELVVEAAQILCVRFRGELELVFDERLVLLGAALHDAGKILHPHEMRGPGDAHEQAGRELLEQNGVAPEIARFCVTHADWENGALEDRMVALADKLWKGKRVDLLEWSICADKPLGTASRQHLASLRSARRPCGPEWKLFAHLDAICESIADGATDRLLRSRV